ncbi:MAG: agmatine deiminase family protein, partial [Bacteroidota bacterium]
KICWLGLLSFLSLSSFYAQPIAPPQDSYRSMAEWEEVEYLILTWTQFIPTLREVVRIAQEECKVLIICQDSSLVKADLKEHGISLAGISYLPQAFNSVWIRDYGPATVYRLQDGQRMLVDWIYNRPRPLDDQLPQAIAEHLGLSLLDMQLAPNGLVHIGGNFLVDGAGLGLASGLILEENAQRDSYSLQSRAESEIDHLAVRYLGLKRFIKLPPLPYDAIDHLDMHMQFLNEETLLVGLYPPGKADGPQIEANLSFLLNQVPSVFGTPLRVVRVPMPAYQGRFPDSEDTPYLTYTNTVILNRSVLVPVYGLPSDSVALKIIQREMPGYRVHGIDCREVIAACGALHCITRTIGINQPLRMLHQPLRHPVSSGFPIKLKAQIQHPEGVVQATIFYRLKGEEDFEAVPMLALDSIHQQWTGYLFADRGSGEVEYFIEAESKSGQRKRHPLTAPQGLWTFTLKPAPQLGMQE